MNNSRCSFLYDVARKLQRAAKRLCYLGLPDGPMVSSKKPSLLMTRSPGTPQAPGLH
jgi:hypothetical protein